MRKFLITLLTAGLVLAFATYAYAAFLGGPMGEQPDVTAQVRLNMPNVVKAGEPIPVEVAFKDFDDEPQLRCGPAGPCTGSLPQTVTDGRAQGHIHVYLQREEKDGTWTDVDSDSFCIPAGKTLTGPFEGTASGTCPALPKGLYRMTAELQSNSHVSVLKATNKPQDAPVSDALYCRVS
jgi:hypothetical protein